jgi:hypothetical protein
VQFKQGTILAAEEWEGEFKQGTILAAKEWEVE